MAIEAKKRASEERREVIIFVFAGCNCFLVPRWVGEWHDHLGGLVERWWTLAVGGNWYYHLLVLYFVGSLIFFEGYEAFPITDEPLACLS